MTSNRRIECVAQIITPYTLIKELVNTHESFIQNGRDQISDILNGKSDRLIIICGPCSIHSINEAVEYAKRLSKLSMLYPKMLFIMRTYFEKPRTTVGWKGFCNDPDMDGSCNINKGLKLAREFLIYCASIRLLTCCEFLDTVSPQWTSDLIAFGAIGARTVESQLHRELVSGLSMPCGFKNPTCGDINIAIDAVVAASHPHSFLGIDYNGKAAVMTTSGNSDTCIILRGSRYGPNYNSADILQCILKLQGRNVASKLIIDCSHDNSQKDYTKQSAIALEVLSYDNKMIRSSVKGFMIESNLVEGSQKYSNTLSYGVSLTDPCIGWEETEQLIDKLYSQYIRYI